MSSGYTAALPAIRTRLAAEWAALRPDVPVQMPNSSKGLDGAEFVKPAAGAYARLSFLSDAGTETIAAGAESPARIYGTILLEVFVPTNGGDLLGYQIAGDFADLWLDHPLPGFLFSRTQVVAVGRVADDASRSKYDALTPFEYEFTD